KHKRKNTAYYWLMKVSLFSVHKNNKNKAKRKPAERSNLLLTFLSRFLCPSLDPLEDVPGNITNRLDPPVHKQKGKRTYGL
ncbi:MAG: hypothetical protein K6B44_08410, partial [Lachnospiraceae bacterium]|nr:hypothetical protein [Lachnospiraceae bacterium]